jgi:hypothetical protein
MRRDVLTTDPCEGDYILSPTGFSWNVLRSNGDHSGKSICVGDREKKTALARLRSLAEVDRADGWETGGTGLFWQIVRCRPAPPRA